MGKYTNLQDDIFSVFADAAWKAENIKTYPNNMIAVDSGNEYIRVSIISSGMGVNRKSISGILIVDIFTSAGNGPSRASLIADKLDLYLETKSLSTVQNVVTQFLTSAMTHSGRDPDNQALHRSVYSIPFNYFGVL